MTGQHHQCNEHELGQLLGDVEGQGGLVCCSPWGCKELEMTRQLNNEQQQTWRPNNDVVSFSMHVDLCSSPKEK